MLRTSRKIEVTFQYELSDNYGRAWRKQEALRFWDNKLYSRRDQEEEQEEGQEDEQEEDEQEEEKEEEEDEEEEEEE